MLPTNETLSRRGMLKRVAATALGLAAVGDLASLVCQPVSADDIPLRTLAGNLGVQIGVEFDGMGVDHNSSNFSGIERSSKTYQDFVKANFSLYSSGVAMGPKSIENYGYWYVHPWVDMAQETGSGFRIDHLYWPGYHRIDPDLLKDAPPDQVESWMRSRAKGLFTNTPYFTDVIVANEAFYRSAPAYNTTDTNAMKWDNSSPYYQAWGTDWVRRGFKIAIEELLAVGKTPGKDVNILYNDLLELPGPGTDTVVDVLVGVRQQLESDFGFAVPIHLGLECHIRDADVPVDKDKSPDWGPDASFISKDALVSHFQNISDRIGGNDSNKQNVHLTEIDYVTTSDREKQRQTIGQLIDSGLESGRVATYNFWDPFRQPLLLYDLSYQRLPGGNAVAQSFTNHQQ